MEMHGEELINAPKEKVWEALNDPEILKQAIPGCEEIEKDSDTSFTAKVKVKVGPVKATFKGAVSLSNIDAPNGYTITGEGKGGAAGFGKGGADVSLTEADGGTLLKYDVKASVGGKMAQIGSRLIDSTAKKLAGEFFTNFNELVSTGAAEEAPAVETETSAAAETTPEPAQAENVAPTQSATPEPQEPEQPAGWMKPSILIPVAIVVAAILYFLTQGNS
ncbi:carbon monoxide dehydrogenase [Sneathiella sp. P13V-1]|uniref:CoxG family protein n=1 Tax=Sneathiella sp. P13V-1 TaxID=2697366 RepID=UPI00187BC3AA|nr:carbon monoxide dehydrogenase subunit G [Sneathiella sp. P13V-1]MBE7637414.1 carbon monoxide dehydrogenase [Sneathiella sp. P13V-1]